MPADNKPDPVFESCTHALREGLPLAAASIPLGNLLKALHQVTEEFLNHQTALDADAKARLDQAVLTAVRLFDEDPNRDLALGPSLSQLVVGINDTSLQTDAREILFHHLDSAEKILLLEDMVMQIDDQSGDAGFDPASDDLGLLNKYLPQRPDGGAMTRSDVLQAKIEFHLAAGGQIKVYVAPPPPPGREPA